MSQDLINRINELSRKEKELGLSVEEKEEQKKLREEYLTNFRSRFNSHLKNIKVVDEKGNDVTPKKLKEEKRNNKTTKTPVQ